MDMYSAASISVNLREIGIGVGSCAMFWLSL